MYDRTYVYFHQEEDAEKDRKKEHGDADEAEEAKKRDEASAEKKAKDAAKKEAEEKKKREELAAKEEKEKEEKSAEDKEEESRSSKKDEVCINSLGLSPSALQDLYMFAHLIVVPDCSNCRRRRKTPRPSPRATGMRTVMGR